MGFWLNQKEVLTIGAFLLGYLVVLLCYPNYEIIGLGFDSGIYLLGAKSLASGWGYTLPNFADHPAIIKYPPLFSALLSLVWMFCPEFPQNIPVLRLIPTICAVLSLGGIYWLFRRLASEIPWLPMLVVAFWAFNPFFLAEATFFMSETLYMALSLGTILIAFQTERNLSENEPGFKKLIPLIMSSVLTFYARTMGILLILAITLWLAKGKGGRTALKYALGVLVLCLPWMLWVSYQQNTNPFFSSFYYDGFVLYSYLQSYTSWYLTTLASTPDWTGMVVANIQGLFQESGRLFLSRLTTVPGLQLGASLIVSGTVLWQLVKGFGSKQNPLIGWYLLLYLGVCLVWTDTQQANRFLFSVFPLLLYLGVERVQAIFPEKGRTVVLTVVLGGMLAANLFFYGQTLANDAEVRQRARHHEAGFQAVVQAIREKTHPQDLILTKLYPAYALHVDRPMMNYYCNFYGFTVPKTQEDYQQVQLCRLMNVKQTRAAYILDEFKDYDALVKAGVLNTQQVFATSDNAIVLYKVLTPVP